MVPMTIAAMVPGSIFGRVVWGGWCGGWGVERCVGWCGGGLRWGVGVMVLRFIGVF